MKKIALVLILLIFASPAFSGAATGAQTHAGYIAIIVIDACRPEYLKLTQLENIESMMAQGTSYANAWTGQLENCTPPAHATFGTGVFPKRHGVIGFSWKDPLTKTVVQPTTLDAVINGDLGQVIAEAHVPTLVGQFKENYPSAKALTISSSKHYASAAMGNYTADYILFAHWLNGAYRPVAVSGHEPPPQFMGDPLLNQASFHSPLGEDDWPVKAASRFIRNEKPRILMVNLPVTDDAGHQTGGTIASAAMERVVANTDRAIGRLLEAYKDAGIFDKTVFVITADHGMIPSTHIIPTTPIRKLIAESKTRQIGGGTPHIWIADTEKAEEVAKSIADQFGDELTGVYYKTSLPSGGYTYLATKAGTGVENVYSYLLSTYACPDGPDIALFAPENTVFQEEVLENSNGSHTSATWFTQHIPMIIAGPGVKKGRKSSFPARLVDVAPTVLSLAGIVPRDMDGVVLADSMLSPTQEQVEAQQAIKPDLIKYQKELMSLSGVQTVEN